ncbi:ABC transporter substrate-binding protein [Pseudomonas guineae]|uniref:ABC transporter substrate-binding protein n=1 Tax=Pseudomonas guineae TaxID=425504 RepID=UPI003CFECC9F|tara:strand:- start:2104 stop:2985 length:882 start_codon:yes stop_codon:yes gene_type:complete
MSRLLLFCCCLLIALPAWTAEIIFSSSTDNPAIQAFVNELKQRRPDDLIRFVALKDLPEPAQLPDTSRLVLLDRPSLDWRLADPAGPPTLALRISRLQANSLSAPLPAQLSLLWSDPSPQRQMRLARLLLPAAKRVGLLYDANSAFLLDEYRQAARAQGMTLVTRRWSDTRDGRPLLYLLAHSDLLLGMNNVELFNSHTVKNLLLTSYTHQRPVIGPSASFVQAGSLASIYSDQSDWLDSLEERLDQPPASWPQSGYPSHFKVTSNPQVARSLAIKLPSNESLAQKLAEGEHP